MQLNTSYKQILSISVPIILGSAVQNVIALSDSVFLYHRSETDFAAIGFVSVFYLIIASIGYGFSKGGQIIIARRVGEKDFKNVGSSFYTMLFFEMTLSVVMFLFMRYGSPWFFSLLIDNEQILSKALEYINYRSFGVFFSYAGVVFIAFYTGIARTTFIIVDTLVLASVNISLNYILIFGKFGFPEMGIGGAGLASTISEVVAFILFIGYLVWDKKNRIFQLNKINSFSLANLKTLLRVSVPIVLQSLIGLGAWLYFFAKVENLGERELAITNLVRMVYLVLSIPCWGFSAGVNTMVSTFIGARKRFGVFPIVQKTALLCLGCTMVLALPFVLYPSFMLYPLLSGGDMTIIADARNIFYVLGLILCVFSLGGVFYNGLAGTGATFLALCLQFFFALIYVGFIEIAIGKDEGNLVMAWFAEVVYWAGIMVFCILYLRSKKWYQLKV